MDKEELQTAGEIMFDSTVLKIDKLDGSLRLFYEQLKTYIKGNGEAYKSYSFGQPEIRQALKEYRGLLLDFGLYLERIGYNRDVKPCLPACGLYTWII